MMPCPWLQTLLVLTVSFLTLSWLRKLRDRLYRIEEEKLLKERVPVQQHPLQSKFTAAPNPAESKASSSSPDPLSGGDSAGVDLAGYDPLSQAVSAMRIENKDGITNIKAEEDFGSFALPLPGMERSWKTRRSEILAKYQFTGTLALANFMDTDNVEAPKENVSMDQTKSRLEQLADPTAESEAKEVLKLSQKEYIAHIERLHEEIVKAWNNQERVKTLKLAIQTAKLLADTSVPQFYPSMFVIVSELLDSFGDLIYERLFKKGNTVENGRVVSLKADFAPEDVPQETRETARNWFYKIASIRELIPRILVECAVLRAYAFIPGSQYEAIFSRLSCLIRGVGDPLCANYIRAYLAKQGRRLAPTASAYLQVLLQDTFTTAPAMLSSTVQRRWHNSALTYPAYVDLHSPAVSWMASCLANAEPSGSLEAICAIFQQSPLVSSFLIECMAAYPPSVVSTHAAAIVSCFKMQQDGAPIALEFTTISRGAFVYKLGALLCESSIKNRKAISSLTNSLWSTLNPSAEDLELANRRSAQELATSSLSDIIAAYSALAVLALRAGGIKTVTPVLTVLYDRLMATETDSNPSPGPSPSLSPPPSSDGTPKASAESSKFSSSSLDSPEVMGALKSLLCRVMVAATTTTSSSSDDASSGDSRASVATLLISPAYAQLLRLVNGKHLVDVSQMLLDAYTGHLPGQGLAQAPSRAPETVDPLVLSALLDVAQAIHDATVGIYSMIAVEVDAKGMVFSQQSTEAARLAARRITRLLALVHFNLPAGLEDKLSFLVECRSKFSGLDVVLCQLVHAANQTAAQVASLGASAAQVRVPLSSRAKAMVKTCLSFSFLTAPGVDSPMRRMALYAEIAEVALGCGLLNHADASLASAIAALADADSLELVQADCSDGLAIIEDKTLSYIGRIAGIIVAAPGDPEVGALMHAQSLLKGIETSPILADKRSDVKIRAYTVCLGMLSGLRAQKALYAFPRSDGNDVMFGVDEEYQEDLQTLLENVMDSIMEKMEDLSREGSVTSKRRRAWCAVGLLNAISSLGVIDREILPFMQELYAIATAADGNEKIYLANSVKHWRHQEGNATLTEFLKRISP
jgi:hypothetical protein